MTRLAVLLLGLAPAMLAAGNQWHWIKTTEIGGQKWDVSQGDAEAEITGGKITATLFWEGSAKEARISLNGSVLNGNVTAKETVHTSDLSGAAYTGKLTLQAWKGRSPGKTKSSPCPTVSP